MGDGGSEKGPYPCAWVKDTHGILRAWIRAAIVRAIGAGVRNCPQSGFRLFWSVRFASSRKNSTCSSASAPILPPAVSTIQLLRRVCCLTPANCYRMRSFWIALARYNHHAPLLLLRTPSRPLPRPLRVRGRFFATGACHARSIATVSRCRSGLIDSTTQASDRHLGHPHSTGCSPGTINPLRPSCPRTSRPRPSRGHRARRGFPRRTSRWPSR